MKNNQHSFLIKKLKGLREQVNWYQASLAASKNYLTSTWFNPYDPYKLKYFSDIEECRYMLESLSNEIRKTKKRIYKAQLDFKAKID